METAIQLEGDRVVAGIIRIISGEFSHRQEPFPVLLLIVGKDPEINRYCTILSFCLTVSLEVKGDRESLLDV